MSIRVLSVDDNKINIRLMEEILRDEGFIVHSVLDSLEVLNEARSFKPEIILLDIMMPRKDGFQICEEIMKDQELMYIPIIMVTAKTESKDVKKALELGAFDYLKKPIEETEVIARILSAYRFKTMQDKLRQMAMKDGLTGIYNHSLLMEMFEKEVNRCKKHDKDIFFAMLDLDFFKNINDNFGHPTGDKVLKEAAGVLINSVKEGDIVGRYGGEEFGIILSELSEREVFDICEGIRRSIEMHEFQTDGYVIHLTVSVGISGLYNRNMLKSSEIIREADEALYRAKGKGRNRTVNYFK